MSLKTFKKILPACHGSFLVWILPRIGGTQHRTTITVNAASTITSFAPRVFLAPITAWVSQTANNSTRAAVHGRRGTILRYPGGSSSDDYHWNGTGAFDANHHWVPSGTTWTYGFVGNETYCGTTGSNKRGYHTPYSHLTDGSAARPIFQRGHQFSKSSVRLPGFDPGQFDRQCHFGDIAWGTPYATSYEVQ